MKTHFLFCLVILCTLENRAQEVETGNSTSQIEESASGTTSNIKVYNQLTRTQPGSTDPMHESSSFIGDPDNLDPLKPNRDNIKEDAEPVLEDIKQVIEAPDKKTEKTAADEQVTIEESSDKKSTEDKKLQKAKSQRRPDEPDLQLEQEFYNIYKRYNSAPTPEDAWAAATAKQTAQEYIVQKGDTLWSISEILFGDPTFWPKLWAINKQGILNPHFIYPNTKIYFYMGDEASAPTLSVGEPAELLPEPTSEFAGEAGVQIPEAVAESDYGEIPDSLPLSRNARYFEGPKKIEPKIELGEIPRFDYENTSEIYITDKPIKTEVAIQLSETSKLRCYEGRILRDIQYLGKLIEDYEIFEPLSSFRTTIGTMNAYRLYGSAQPYQNNKLKLYDCKGILATNLVVIPKEKIKLLRNKKISVTKKARVIGGPDVVEQRLFLLNQLAYVDFGDYDFAKDQEFKTMSQVTDEINGNFKVIEKFGSFGVVMFTEVNDVIEIGDKVILK